MVEAIRVQNDKYEVGEFWSAKQRQGHSLHHTVSYRASFKPELPAFFIREYLPKKKKFVYDPFGGRGTTAVQANLEGHFAVHNDIHPLSIFLARSRQVVPSVSVLEEKLSRLKLDMPTSEEEDDHKLLPFFHPETLKELKNFKKIMTEDHSPEMQFLSLIALSRLHGHSPGFFSVYTFPQVSIPWEAQAKNNIKRMQKPEYRSIKPRILAKFKRDLKESLPPFYHEFSKENIYTLGSASSVPLLQSESIDLIVTSPPFLDKVDYEGDNWLRHWFLGFLNPSEKKVSIFRSLLDWKAFIQETLIESRRVLKPGAPLVMEVGEVQKGKNVYNLDEEISSLAREAGLLWEKTYIQDQKFTKLSHCWNVSNNEKGTNSNRCVVFRKA